MAEGFGFSSTPLQTRETARLRQQEEVKKQLATIEAQESSESSADHDGRLSQVGKQSGEEKLLPSLTSQGSLPQKKCLCNSGPRQWGYRNHIASAISFMLVISPFLGLQSVQTSLNGYLGVISLSLVYGCYFGITFMTPTILRILGPKYALLFGYSCHVIYIATNFYPELYTLVPSSILLGIGSGPLWAGICVHLARTASTVSPLLEHPINTLLFKFSGVFFLFYHLAHIVGNFVSSLALYSYGGSYEIENNTCSFLTLETVSNEQRYSMLSVFLVMAVAGVVVGLIFIDRIPIQPPASKVMKSKVRRYFKEPLTDLMKIFISWKMLLLGGLTLYSGLELSFVYSSFTQQVISDCVGIGQVGFAMIVFGLFSAASSVIYTALSRKIPRMVFAILAALVNAFFLLFIQFYPLIPNFPLVYTLAIFWGMADGFWRTLSTDLVGLLFPNDQEAAYSVWRIWITSGFIVGFAIAQIGPFDTRLRIVLIALLIAFGLYLLLEVFCSKFGKQYLCKYNLGVFDGPTTTPSVVQDHSMLTETMLDTQIGIPSTNDKTLKKLYDRAYFGNGYAPPAVRSATYSVGDGKKRQSKRQNTPSLLTLEERVESQQSTEEIEHTTEQSVLHTAVF